MLTKFKAYIWGSIAAAFGLLWIALRVVTRENSKLRYKAEVAQQEAKRRQYVLQEDKEIDEHEQEVEQDIRRNRIGPDDDINDRLWRDKSD